MNTPSNPETVETPPDKRGQTTRLFIAIPVYGAVASGTVASLLQLMRQRAPFEFVIRTREKDSHVDRTRNALTAEFMESGCDKMLFLDSDLVFAPRDIARIASHDEDIVGGFYPIKNYDSVVRWCVNGIPGRAHTEPDARGLTPVSYIGTGFMCIHRRVFEKMLAAGIAKRYRSDYEPRDIQFAFWASGVYDTPAATSTGEPRWLSEDWMFCQRWLDLGGSVWGDCAVYLNHVGEAQWPLPHQATGLQEIGQVGGDSAEPPPINRVAPQPETKNRAEASEYCPHGMSA